MPRLAIASRSIDGLRDADAWSLLETEILPAYLQKQRWFASKDARLEAVRIAQAISVANDERSLLLIIQVSTSGDTVDYQCPITLLWDRVPDAKSIVAEVTSGSHQGWLVDAYSNDVFVRHLLALPLADTQATPQLGFRPSESFDAQDLSEATIVRTGAEQSNTSILIGPAILKAYRRLAGGIHPEQEIGAFLTQASFKGTPSLLGTIELRAADGPPVTLGIVQARVEGATDGWGYVTDRLGRLGGAEPGALVDLQRLADRLGACTAGMHLALSQETSHADLAPAPLSGAWIKAWSEDVAASADAILARIDQQPPSGQQQWPTLVQVRSFIAAQSIDAPSFSAIRIHGDYHLGQVLVTETDIFIVDFEGEPMRPLAERRRKSVALRDIAGMLRSFDYASASANVSGETTVAAAISEVRQRFLRGYLPLARSSACFPADIVQANKVLMLGLVEKALYEIRYELNNRPDWLVIPLQGLKNLIETPDLYAFEAG
ncbi:phosphotransferase [Tardiphaga sp.]|uniref:maltokinase N-terminal cap-like domain-containing protein n=1 Tax=Tardiphaga sp. TaxID=1926292 RepID=UPI0037DA1AF6